MKIKILSAMLLFVSSFACSFRESNTYNMNHVTSILHREVQDNKTPSVQYAFFDVDSTIFEFSEGYSDVKAQKVADSKTTYNLFSVTKTFTALAVLQLAEAGKLELKKPVADYLYNFPFDPEITVEQLLNHSAGIPNPLPLKWIHLVSEHEDFDRNSFFKDILVQNSRLKSAPGVKFSYSNLGYVVLGQLIERVSGKDYETFIEENIFRKVGSNKSHLGFTIQADVHAKGYQKSWSFMNLLLGFLVDKKKFMGETEEKWKPFHHFYINGMSYGGMIGSKTGLILYGQSLLQSDSPLLGETLKKMLFTESVINGKPTGMSFSWYTGKLKGNVYVAHAGGGGGYYLELRLYPELGVGSVVLYNRSGMKDERILDKLDNFFIADKPQ